MKKHWISILPIIALLFATYTAGHYYGKKEGIKITVEVCLEEMEELGAHIHSKLERLIKSRNVIKAGEQSDSNGAILDSAEGWGKWRLDTLPYNVKMASPYIVGDSIFYYINRTRDTGEDEK